MSFNRALILGYRVATALILAGFAMLCQPFDMTLFTLGFPVLIVGVALFLILDHVPEKTQPEEES